MLDLSLFCVTFVIYTIPIKKNHILLEYQLKKVGWKTEFLTSSKRVFEIRKLLLFLSKYF